MSEPVGVINQPHSKMCSLLQKPTWQQHAILIYSLCFCTHLSMAAWKASELGAGLRVQPLVCMMNLHRWGTSTST